MAATNGSIYASLSKSLLDGIVDATTPTPERTNDILTLLQNESSKKKQSITVAILESTKIGKVLTKTVKACKRHKRTESDTATKLEWDTAIKTAEDILASYKETADEETKITSSKNKSASNTEAASKDEGLPTSATIYKTRLVSQKKEMYKDPPVLGAAGAHIIIEDALTSKPTRNKTNGEHAFKCGQDDSIKLLLKTFHPNRSPEEVLRSGSFGGTYFRPITSAVTNIKYNSSSVLKDTVSPTWISGLDKPTMLTSSKYNKSINKFGVKCGGSLGMWESSGWMSDSDPYGWFQWYCRFYSGRRCSDDTRQISRWCKSAGLKGRFRSQLCNKVIAAGTTAGDVKISPVIRQTLLHWGLEVTEDVLEKHRKR